MSNNIIQIAFGESRNAVISDEVYQYDYGQKIEFTDIELPEYFEAHFTNVRLGEASTQIGHNNVVDIPNSYLRNGSAVYGWIYLHTGSTDGESEYTFTILVTSRAKPVDEVTPEDEDVITQAIAAMQAVQDEVADLRDETEGFRDSAEAQADSAAGSAGSAGTSATNAAASAEEASRHKTSAQGYAEAAALSAGTATDRASAADASAAAASGSASAADASAAAASGSASAASASKTAAESARDTAISAKDAAVSAKNDALTAKTNAEDAAESAAQSKNAASASALAAANSADDADAAKADAITAKNAAVTAQTAAEAAQTAAETAQGRSEAAATSAEQLIGDLAKEETQLLIEGETEEITGLLEQIIEQGHSSGDLNGYSLNPGPHDSIQITYTDQEDEESTATITAITDTTAQGIADMLGDLADIWKAACNEQ